MRLFATLGSVLAAYLIYLAVIPDAGASLLINGWLVSGFEIAVSILCLSRAFAGGRLRVVPLVLGAATLSWSIGDLCLTFESIGGATPPTPSLADAFYVGFFPLAYAGIFMFMRGEVRRVNNPSWLDSSIAAVGAGAVCAAFAFHSVLATTGGSTLAVATNLAYPVGDLLLLVLVVGGTAMLAGRSRSPWVLLAGGMALNALGDSFNLFGSSVGSSHVGVVVNGIAWPTAIFMIALAMWLPAGYSDPLALQRPPGFALPGFAAVAGLIVLVVGTINHPGPVAVVLAALTMVLVGIRLASLLGDLRALTRKRHQQAVTDQLTGIGNRRYLFDILETWFTERADAEPGEHPLAFLFIDLDRFKEINDSFGHPVGDELLRHLGERLGSALREGDVLIRFGGDEFAALLFDTDAAEATLVAERVTASLADPFVLDAVTVTVGASIGIAVAPRDGSNPDALVTSADVAMYRAKLDGRPFTLYDPVVDQDNSLLRLAGDLGEAIAQDRLALHYQPQLDLATGELRAVEALLRWEHPSHGSIPPMRLLPVAEQAGLMGPLTRWVLDRALAQCAVWHGEGRELVVSVNISPTNLLDPGFSELVVELLERHGLKPGALMLEITETCIIREFDRSKAVVDELRAAGVDVSIDDFGTGFTSLAYLSGLAAGQLKLDRGFVTRLAAAKDDRDMRLVRSTIELGHALDMRVVAEGIEDHATLELLRSLGCDIAQGFLIGEPVPAGEVPEGSREAAFAPAALRERDPLGSLAGAHPPRGRPPRPERRPGTPAAAGERPLSPRAL